MDLVWVSEVVTAETPSTKRKRSTQNFQGAQKRKACSASSSALASRSSQSIQPMPESMSGVRFTSNDIESRVNTDNAIWHASPPPVTPTTNFAQEPPQPETLLHFEALDFVNPHYCASHAGNLLSVADLDFLAPLLEISSLDFVNSQPGLLNFPSFSPDLPVSQFQNQEERD
ncbi:hypothetical protein N7540_000290 [Penicillium herquei]|nr:hypothetical protein N7540_000290 [Penicillium herquei]